VVIAPSCAPVVAVAALIREHAHAANHPVVVGMRVAVAPQLRVLISKVFFIKISQLHVPVIKKVTLEDKN
jgi:hypothetical protein